MPRDLNVEVTQLVSSNTRSETIKKKLHILIRLKSEQELKIGSGLGISWIQSYPDRDKNQPRTSQPWTNSTRFKSNCIFPPFSFELKEGLDFPLEIGLALAQCGSVEWDQHHPILHTISVITWHTYITQNMLTSSWCLSFELHLTHLQKSLLFDWKYVAQQCLTLSKTTKLWNANLSYCGYMQNYV